MQQVKSSLLTISNAIRLTESQFHFTQLKEKIACYDLEKTRYNTVHIQRQMCVSLMFYIKIAQNYNVSSMIVIYAMGFCKERNILQQTKNILINLMHFYLKQTQYFCQKLVLLYKTPFLLELLNNQVTKQLLSLHPCSSVRTLKKYIGDSYPFFLYVSSN